MELKLSLGISPARPLEEITGFDGDRLSLEMKLGVSVEHEQQRRIKMNEENRVADKDLEKKEQGRWSVDPPVQLNLLPLAPVPSLDSTQQGSGGVAAERASSRGSDEEENNRGRKKLRLSREQSASLENNFKAHSTLNPKLKFALAKQLNLRPRQIEVWFQNRRARMKLKQMEIDCEFLRRRSEELREDNRRLCKEVAELRAIKSFHIQVPPTTLSICPSCERFSPPTSPPQPPPTPR